MAFGLAQPPILLTNHVYKKVTTDANCLFRAVTVILGQDENEFRQVKMIALSYAIAHQDEYRGKIGNISGFLFRLLSEDEWATKQELEQLAKALGTNIRVYTNQDKAFFDIIGRADNQEPFISIYYNPISKECGAFTPGVPPAQKSTALTFAAIQKHAKSVEASRARVAECKRLKEKAESIPPLSEAAIIRGTTKQFNTSLVPDKALLLRLLKKVKADYQALAGNEQKKFELMLRVNSFILGHDIIELLKTNPLVEDAAEAGEISYLDSYFANIQVLLGSESIDYHELVPSSFIAYAGAKILLQLEMYCRNERDDERLFNLIQQTLISYRISLFHRILHEFVKIGNDETIEACKEAITNIADSIIKALFHPALSDQGLIVPLGWKGHSIYLQIYLKKQAEREIAYFLMHNYGEGSFAENEDGSIAPVLVCAFDSSEAATTGAEYLITALSADPCDDLEEVLPILYSGKIDPSCPKPPLSYSHVPQQNAANCTAYGYEIATSCTFDKVGLEWHHALRETEVGVLGIRLSLGLTWPHPSSYLLAEDHYIIDTPPEPEGPRGGAGFAASP